MVVTKSPGFEFQLDPDFSVYSNDLALPPQLLIYLYGMVIT